jgi:large subunit ribosomal protein L35
MKTHKAMAKRFKVTKNGKVLKRKAGQAHFNSRESGATLRNKRRDVTQGEQFTKTIKKLTGNQ